jgi:hypothetical protein
VFGDKHPCPGYAADVANVICTSYPWKLLSALPEPWETPGTAVVGDIVAHSGLGAQLDQVLPVVSMPSKVVV